MKDDPDDGLGISWLWALPRSHPFTKAGDKHDAAYITDSWEQKHLTRYVVDRRFLNECLAVAGNSTILKTQAYTFYGIVRSLGWLFWEGR